MKTLMLIIAMLTVFISVQAINVTNVDAETTTGEEEVKKVKIKVKSVWFKNKEAKALEKEIADLDGIEEVYVCPFRSKAIVEYNPDVVFVDDIEQVILDEGYGVK